MRLTFKLVASFMLAVVSVVILYGLVDITHETRLFRKDTDKLARDIHDSVHEQIAVASERGGRAGIIEVVQKTNQTLQHVRVRWVVFGPPFDRPDCPTVSPQNLNPHAIERHELIVAQDEDGALCLHSYWSIPINSIPNGGLEISRSMEELDEKRQSVVVRTIVQVTLTLLVLALVAAIVGIRHVGRPLRQLIDKTRRIAAGDLSRPVQIGSRDELGELAATINEMCAKLAEAQQRIQEETASRISAVEALRHVDRLRTVGRLAAGIAHQLGTPLNVVSGQAEMMVAGELSDEQIKSGAKVIYSETERMTASIRQLLDFARPSEPQRAQADVAQMVRETAALLTPVAKKNRVELELELPPQPLEACLDMGQIQQVVANLIMNAVQAMPQGGKIQVQLTEEDVAVPGGASGGLGSRVCLRVRDDGPGISEEDLEQVFEPFFTTKEVGEGTGLGLSIAYGIVHEHGGSINVSSQPGHGTCFTVLLPKELDA
jgi:signal transduction histidine kinase